MEQRIKYKYGTILKVLSIISGVLMALVALAILFLGTVIIDILEESSGQDLGEFGSIFYIFAVICGILAIVMLIAAARVSYSKGWNIFIVVLGGITVVGSLSEFQFVGIFYYGAMAVFAILNLVEDNKRSKGIASGSEVSSLESKLTALNDLYDKGLIGVDEYQRSRQEVLEKHGIN